MKTTIDTEILKSGERLEIACVIPPDGEHVGQILPFLGHKPANYLAHIDAAFQGKCDGLETRFYVGLLDGELVGNIMTVETGGIGILGHVHTRLDQRRKGICAAIMRRQIADFERRRGKTLLLGTGYQSAAYNIYASFGFKDWHVGKPGLMRYDSVPPSTLANLFVSGRYRPVAATWKHWPLVALLASIPAEVELRSLTFGLWNVGLLEGPYCQYMQRHAGGQNASASVLESDTGAVVAMATCVPDERWPGIHLLDLFAHPVVDMVPLTLLLESMGLPQTPIQCYADPQDASKIGALKRLDFHRTTLLPAQARRENGGTGDVWVYTRG